MLGQKPPELMNIQAIVETIFGSDLHKKRQLSLSYAALVRIPVMTIGDSI